MRAGRPSLPPAERHDAAILVRLLPCELEQLRALAAHAGLGAGQYARDALRRHIARASRADRTRHMKGERSPQR